MPSPHRQLRLPEARALIADSGFGGSEQSGPTVGVELESFAVPARDPADLPDVKLPAGSRLTFEPGGQVELSSRPAGDVATACGSLAHDLAALCDGYSTAGVALIQGGLSTCPARRRVDCPRYRAMEAYFDGDWPQGRVMMCRTAAVQVNLGFGRAGCADRRWRAANALGPVLAAAFTSSTADVGGRDRRPWACARLANWLGLDPSRTRPVPMNSDPGRAWADYALEARVMLIRTDTKKFVALGGEMLTARAWIENGHPLGWPTREDVAYHLTTLFPPVRPKGWLELRMMDALPDPWWRVPVAVAAALVDDEEAVQAAQPASDRWWQAARDGLADPAVGPAVSRCAERALDGLDRVGADSGTAMLTEQWAAAVRKGRQLPWT